MKKTLTFFLPQLLANPDNQYITDSVLATLLSKAAKLEVPNTIEKNIKSYFQGFDLGEIPAGALGAFYHEISETLSQQWCRADPIECHVDHQSAYVVGKNHLKLKSTESQTLAGEIKTLLKQDNISLFTPTPMDWFIQIPNETNVCMNDLTEVIGKNMGFLLPSGPDEIFWRRLGTECQMLLSQNTINQQRLSKGLGLVSSLWFWGKGKLPDKLNTHFASVYSNDPTFLGCAKFANISYQQIPTFFDPNHYNVGHSLIADNQCDLECYEQHWFKPLLASLKSGDIHQVTINMGDGRAFVIEPKHLKYFWKGVKPLSHFNAPPLKI